VITTLWPVEDEASGALMVAFYENLQAGMTVAEALRQAQVERLAEDETSSPYYWAAFSLTGDYRGEAER
jgi:CHAT domain-containing protein